MSLSALMVTLNFAYTRQMLSHLSATTLIEFLVVGILPDYLALGKTRLLMRRFWRKSALWWIIIIPIDVIGSLVISNGFLYAFAIFWLNVNVYYLWRLNDSLRIEFMLTHGILNIYGPLVMSTLFT